MNVMDGGQLHHLAGVSSALSRLTPNISCGERNVFQGSVQLSGGSILLAPAIGCVLTVPHPRVVKHTAPDLQRPLLTLNTPLLTPLTHCFPPCNKLLLTLSAPLLTLKHIPTYTLNP